MQTKIGEQRKPLRIVKNYNFTTAAAQESASDKRKKENTPKRKSTKQRNINHDNLQNQRKYINELKSASSKGDTRE